jgi:hypothetical protein
MSEPVTCRLCPLLLVGLLLVAACTGGGSSPSSETGEGTSSAATVPTSAATPSEATRSIDLSSLMGRIAFSGGPPHAEDVYVINADGTALARVTSDPAADFDPTLSPDGGRIAPACSRRRAKSLTTMRTNRD